MQGKIIILGKPNVGKSSLFNRLIKDKVAITSEVEGTTRDINIRPLLLGENAFNVELCDTAGLMKKADGIFKNIKKMIFDFINENDLILYVISAESSVDDEDLRTFRSLKNAVLVVNKIDIEKVERWEYNAFGAEKIFYVSSLHNRGIKQLTDFLALRVGNSPLGEGNSVLGMQFRTCENFWTSTDSSLVESPKISTNTKATPQSLPLRFCESQNLGGNQAKNAESNKNSPSLAEGARGWVKTPSLLDSAKQNRGNPPIKKTQGGLPRSHSFARNDDSFLDSAESQNLVNLKSCEAPENSPASWCKKSESKGAEVPPADFLLEAEKRGSPPKSEKRSFWRVGGAGRGVQPFCEKEKSENNENCVEVAESTLDSAESQNLQNGLPRRFCESARNDDSFLDSAIPTQEANSAIADEFLGFCEASDKDRTQVHRGSEPKQSLKSRCESKFATINIGIIGRVNVGKSSILNALLGKERSLVSEIEGTTIDPVSDEITHGGQILRFVDTAGIRRASKIEGIEKFALTRTKRILEQSNIVLLVLDSSRDFVELDEKISGLSQKYNLGVIILLNKWDIKCADFSALQATIKRKFAYLSYAPILTISALKMRHIDEIKDTILRVWENFNRRIPTAKLNEHIKIATARHPLPSERGKIVKIYYASQVDCAPPQILLVMNRPRALHFSYKRYLVNYFRANFDFSGVPLVILSKGRGKDEIAE